jgi:hypothetical protein
VGHLSLTTPLSSLRTSVSQAIAAVERTSFSDGKAVTLDAEVVAAMRGMFPPGKVYRFDMVANTTIGASSSGAILQAISISPAVASYGEYSSLASIFDEIRLVTAEMELIPAANSDGLSLVSTGTALPLTAIACGVDYTNITSAPTGYNNVLRLPWSANVARTSDDLTGSRVFKMIAPKSLPFARVANPAIQDPVAGCVGAFMVAGSGTAFTPNAIYYTVTLRCVVELRNRI